MPFWIGFESVSICCLAAPKHFELLTVTIPAKEKEQKASKRSRVRGAAPCGRGHARPLCLAAWLTSKLGKNLPAVLPQQRSLKDVNEKKPERCLEVLTGARGRAAWLPGLSLIHI